MSNRSLRMQKRLLQYGVVPFSFAEIEDPTYTISFKGNSQAYTNATHGSYYPTLGESGVFNAGTFRANFSISFKDLGCEDKIRYARFLKRELAKSGKLWAVQNGTEIVWTNARITDISESVDQPYRKDMFNFSATFELLDGVWTMAKRTRTFLCEYCPNRFEDFDPNYCVDLYDYYGVCSDENNCLPCDLDMEEPEYKGCEWKPLCYYPLFNSRYTSDMDGNIISIPSIYDMFGVDCANQWYINYNCGLEKDYFCYDEPWGRKWKLSSSSIKNVTSKTFCSRTDLPTTGVMVRLLGTFVDPTVTVNGDTVKIPSDNGAPYEGIITIGFGNKIWYTTDEREPYKNAVDITFTAERSNTPMFELHAGKNTIEVTGNVYNKSSWVYVDEKAITF